MVLFAVLNFSVARPRLELEKPISRLSDVAYEGADLSWKLQIGQRFRLLKKDAFVADR